MVGRFFKTAGIYFVGNIITKLAAFFLLPLYSSRIAPSEYGTYGLSITIINVLVPIVFISIWEGVFRFSFECSNDKYKVFNNGFIIMLTGSLLYIIGTIFTYMFIKFSNPFLICLYSLATAYQYFYTVIARSLMDNRLFVFSGVVNTCVAITLNVALITGFDIGVASLYISYIVGVVIQIFIIENKKNFLKYFSFRRMEYAEIIKYIKFSIPVSFSAISNWLFNGLTQIYITYVIGSYYNGLYNLANKFSSVLILTIGIFQFAWYELAYDIANNADKSRYYQKSISEILRLSLITLSILILLVKIVYPIMIDAQYRAGLKIVPILLIGTMANAYAGFAGTLFLADKRTLSLFTTTLVAGGINFLGLKVLTPKFGFVGAVLALCIAYIFFAAIRVIILKRKMGILPYLYSIAPILLLIPALIIFYIVKSNIILLWSTLLLCIISLLFIQDLIKLCLNMVQKIGDNSRK